jgi:hypothetical protein
MFNTPSNKELSQLEMLRSRYRSAQTILDAWENDPSYPSDKHEKALREFQEAEHALDRYQESLVARYPNHKF